MGSVFGSLAASMLRPAAVFLLALASLATVLAYDFNCPQLPSRAPATTVADLHPQDIRAVASLGDSITAGFSMKDQGFLSEIFEYRGSVYSSGADPGEPTVYNFLKHYGGPLVGGSVNCSLPLDTVFLGSNYSIIPHNPEIDRLNGAQSNAVLSNSFEQIDYVAAQLAAQYPEFQIGQDWILIHLLMGANDLCWVCHDYAGNKAGAIAVWKETMREVLQHVKETFQRAFLAVIPIGGFSRVYEFAREPTPDYPAIIFQEEIEGCYCFITSNETREMLDEMAASYAAVTAELVAEYDDDDQFAAVIQPMFYNLLVGPTPSDVFNRTMVSPLDRFHPAAVSDKLMAIGLWNDLFSPLPKPNVTTPDPVPFCPTNSTVFWSPQAERAGKFHN